ncbi:MAG TPA: crotonase/enoyl-CoA hydratase family protein [Acidimicrobiales bacterium]|nr:crotonase/enoyl-CoA hydratase family protein [Acidimicrobiales bacterium]
MSTTPTCFDVERIGKVAHLRLNRPDAYNSMTREFWSELPALVRELDDDGTVRAIVISSTGKHFSAGMDLAVFTGGGGDALGGAAADGSRAEEGRVRARLLQSVRVLQESFTALERVRMPVIAAIQGGCIGGAVDMVSACDLRYASADAFFCVQEINLGMTADVGTLQRLPKIIPEGIAREWAYRGHRVPAARAAEVGLVNEVFADHESLVAGALEIAQEIASKSPLAIWGTKEMITFTRDHSVADSLNHMAAWQSGMFQPADMLETFVAKGEQRDPDFPDLLRHSRGL